MATPTILIVCPECGKKIKAPENVFGKKVRCKFCQAAFVAGKGSGKAPPGKPAKPAKPTTVDAVKDEEEDDGNPYGLVNVSLAPRCPECANEIDEGQVICLQCGYNLRSREYAKTRKVYHQTFGDHFIWLLPGIACALAVLSIIGFNVWYLLKIDDVSKAAGEPWYLWLFTISGVKLWVVIMSLFLNWLAGKFAFKRLILHPRPPEVEKVK
ncbi:MAG: hypothetical protein ACYC3I_00075 [Gemmataceae bacterium]